MGGHLRECGCFDGPHSPDDLTLVSVRCEEHRDEPVPDGYVRMTRAAASVAATVGMRNAIRRAERMERRGRMALPGGRR